MTLDTLQPFEQSFAVSPTQTPKSDDNYLLETFHQYPHGDFRPTFYNPFEIKHRRRTSRAQLKVLEKSYNENPKPSAAIRRILAQKLEMTPRGVQIWFQNRRAKAKQSRRKSSTKTEVEQEPASLPAEQKEPYDDMNAVDTSLNSSDINQSSILFSQFFTSNFVQQPEEEEQDWSAWQLNENVRTVATTAAAVAAASSSYDMRRKSCPIMHPYQHVNTMTALNQPQASYLSPSWSPLLSKDYGSNNVSPMQQPFKRNFSYDANSLDMMNAYSQQTPPLTASCSASTVAGSPISLDNLYMNDPIVLPNQYYNQPVSSPLATTTYIANYMPQFI
ncbi:hypothetical protein [Parasitella parasitica]|uniref:Homeobox domain-containing protein n=1 Tax=Parasitella parasitica TaxID=35722 RepID=A0A0B7NQU2_9FUNG|nr:hypothetical protein [Parasitella parasitica]